MNNLFITFKDSTFAVKSLMQVFARKPKRVAIVKVSFFVEANEYKAAAKTTMVQDPLVRLQESLETGKNRLYARLKASDTRQQSAV
ncbi:hypothetical protein E8R44_26680 [Escherichia coli]|nr:hypothetical protein E8R44_26680 [Escherichia coli]